MKSIRSKIALLITATSIILIVGILTVSYMVNKKILQNYVRVTYMILVFMHRTRCTNVFTAILREAIWMWGLDGSIIY